MKGKNTRISKRLALLLSLASLLIGLGLVFGLPYCDVKAFIQFYADLLTGIFGELTLLLAFLIFPLLILIAIVYLLSAHLLFTFLSAAVQVVLAAVLAVRSGLLLRRAPSGQPGKNLAQAALVLNTVTAVYLLLLDLLFLEMGFRSFAPWGILSLAFCLAGGALPIPVWIAHRKRKETA